MLKRLIFLAFLLAQIFGQPVVHAAQITGTLKNPGSTPISNASITLTLSQSGILPGSYAVTTDSIACSTSVDGSVAGLRNPLTPLVGTPTTASGSLSGVVYLRYTVYSASGTTIASPIASVNVVGANNTISIASPSAVTGAAGWKVYAGSTSGSETLQATKVGFGTAHILTSLASGTAIPTANTTTCSPVFNDAIIPSDTSYTVTVTSANGNIVAGFPQKWYLYGSSWDLSQGYPVSNRQARFPAPIISNPSSNARQSVASPLTLNGYTLTAGAIELPDNSVPPTCAANRSYVYTGSNHLLYGCENGGAPVAFLSGSGGGGSGTWTRATDTSLPSFHDLYSASGVGDRVLAGLTSSDINNAGVFISNQFLYAASASTNASVAALGYDASTSAIRLASGASGTGAYLPLDIVTGDGSGTLFERTRWTTGGGILHGTGLFTSDVFTAEPQAIVSGAGMYIISNTVNAAVGGMVQDSSSSTFRLISGRTGTGTSRDMAFVLGNTPTEVARWTIDGALEFPSLLTPPALSASGKMRMYGNGTTLRCSQSGAAYANCVGSGGGATTGFTEAVDLQGGGITNIYPTNSGDRILSGLANSDITDQGVVISNQFLYATSGSANASVAALGYDGGSTSVRLASGKSGSGTYRPLAILTNGTEQTRWTTTGGILHQLTSTDAAETNAIVSSSGIYVASASSNAAIGGIVQDGGSSTFRVVSGRTGSGTARDMAFVLWNGTANVEAYRATRDGALEFPTLSTPPSTAAGTKARIYYDGSSLKCSKASGAYASCLGGTASGVGTTSSVVKFTDGALGTVGDSRLVDDGTHITFNVDGTGGTTDATSYGISKIRAEMKLDDDPNANAFGIGHYVNINNAAGTTSYEKGAAIFWTQTADDSSYTGPTCLYCKDAVGLDTRAVLFTPTNGRAFGIETQAEIYDGSYDGYLVGIESGVVNNAVGDQAQIDTINSKVGIGLVGGGTTPSTAAVIIGGTPGWHKGVVTRASALYGGATDSFLEILNSGDNGGVYKVTKTGTTSICTNTLEDDTSVKIQVSCNQNLPTTIHVSNSTNGTTSASNIQVGEGNVDVVLRAVKSSYTAVTGWSSLAALYTGSSATNGLVLGTNTGRISFQQGGSTTPVTKASLETGGEFRLYGTSTTANHVGFLAPASPANTTYTLPSAYPGGNGYSLVSTTGGLLSWSNVSGGGGSTDWTRAADAQGGGINNLYNTTAADRVVVGLSNSDITDTGVLIANQFVYAASAATNASVAAMGYDGGSTTIRFASGRSGTGTARDMSFTTGTSNTERLRITTTGQIIKGGTSYDGPATSIVNIGGGVFSASATANASVIGLGVATGSYTALTSGLTGAGSYLPMAFFTNGSEKMRLQLDGTLSLGTTSDISQLLYVNGSSFFAGAASLNSTLDVVGTITNTGRAANGILYYSSGFTNSSNYTYNGTNVSLTGGSYYAATGSQGFVFGAVGSATESIIDVSNTLQFYASSSERFRLDNTNSSTATGMRVFFNGSIRQVEVGAADSGGTGYRLLRVTN